MHFSRTALWTILSLLVLTEAAPIGLDNSGVDNAAISDNGERLHGSSITSGSDSNAASYISSEVYSQRISDAASYISSEVYSQRISDAASYIPSASDFNSFGDAGSYITSESDSDNGGTGASFEKRWEEIIEDVTESQIKETVKDITRGKAWTLSQNDFVEKMMNKLWERFPDYNIMIWQEKKDLQVSFPGGTQTLKVEKWVAFSAYNLRYGIAVFRGEGSMVNTGDFGTNNWYANCPREGQTITCPRRER